MNKKTTIFAAVLASSLLAVSGAMAADIKVRLAGDNEVPPVKTSATGEGTISIADDGAVSGGVTIHGVDATMAHIHMAAAGQNGPVIVHLVKEGDKFNVPPGTKLDAAQMKAFRAGELYVNVHSAAHKGGELRGQLK